MHKFKTKQAILLAALLLPTGLSYAQQGKGNEIKLQRFSELQQYFHYEEHKPVIISGHRGGMLPYYPENTLYGFKQSEGKQNVNRGRF